jgi:hypothetical protein
LGQDGAKVWAGRSVWRSHGRRPLRSDRGPTNRGTCLAEAGYFGPRRGRTHISASTNASREWRDELDVAGSRSGVNEVWLSVVDRRITFGQLLGLGRQRDICHMTATEWLSAQDAQKTDGIALGPKNAGQAISEYPAKRTRQRGARTPRNGAGRNERMSKDTVGELEHKLAETCAHPSPSGAKSNERMTKETIVEAGKETDDPEGKYYWGRCPECDAQPAFVNIGRNHWFFCATHKVCWCVGSNLFSSWREETEERWQRNAEFLRGFQDVSEPWEQYFTNFNPRAVDDEP